jgi:beta-lactamase regulating signal transducer with metallopeptidase domain
MNGTLQALGWTLINFCWEAAAIATLYLIADLGLKNTRSQTRYLFALATLSTMFLAFAGTLGYETLHSPAASILPLDNASTHEVATAPVKEVLSKVELLTNARTVLHWTTLLPWLDGMWMLGVIGLSTRSLSGWLWLQRLRRATTEKAPDAIQASFERVCMKLGIARSPELRLSEIVPGPMAIGFLRTLVLLPASALLALSPEQLEAIFAHELAHVRRADYFWILVQTLAETLFFFHPAVWGLGKRLREQRELCCDDIAIATCPDPLVYATALFRLEDQRAAGLNLAMALDGHQSSITFRSRILRILGETVPQSQSAGLRPLSLFAVCTSLFFLLSPLPKALGVAAQSLPVKQILAMPTEIARATKNLSLGSMHSTSAMQGAAEAQHSSAPSPIPSQVTESASDYFEYENQMRAVGYDVNQGKYAVMQRVGVTPAYAKEMAGLGFGTPPVGQLMKLKEQGVTGQYLTAMRAAGLEPRGFEQLISYRIFNITPEFVAGMRAAGFDSVPPGKLKNLRAVGVTSEYAKAMKQQFPATTVKDLLIARARLGGNDLSSSPANPNVEPPAFPGSATPQPSTVQPPQHIQRQPGPWWSALGQPPGVRQPRPRWSVAEQPDQSESPPPLIQ